MVPSDDKRSTITKPQPKADDRNRRDALPPTTKQDPVQGEGDYRSAREFNDLERKFVTSGKVTAAARAAAPTSRAEGEEMLEAEQKGKRKSKGEDPAPTTPTADSAAPKIPATKADRQRR